MLGRQETRPRLRKPERHEQILLELKLRPHVRIAELAGRFGVSAETVRRDVEELSLLGLLDRAHGGASAMPPGHYPSFDERTGARTAERERIGRLAASLVRPGDSVMIDSGSTTLQLARFLAFEATPCTVITNSLPVAMALGQSAAAEVILCPGNYLAAEAAVVGSETVDFIRSHNVQRCLIGASGLTRAGVSESVRGFAAVKRAMLSRSRAAHLLIDAEKFGRAGLAQVCTLRDLASAVVDRAPEGDLGAALRDSGTEVLVAP